MSYNQRIKETRKDKWYVEMTIPEMVVQVGALFSGQPNLLTGGASTLHCWQERYRLLPVKGGLYGSDIQEMVVLIQSAFMETGNREPTISDRMRILKLISVSLYPSGLRNEEYVARAIEALTMGLGVTLYGFKVVDNQYVEITLLRTT